MSIIKNDRRCSYFNWPMGRAQAQCAGTSSFGYFIFGGIRRTLRFEGYTVCEALKTWPIASADPPLSLPYLS
jgi:hypothetical protein